MIVNKLFQGYTLNSYLFNMSCGLEMEKLKLTQVPKKRGRKPKGGKIIKTNFKQLNIIKNDVKFIKNRSSVTPNTLK